jgi:hypothetical protein
MLKKHLAHQFVEDLNLWHQMGKMSPSRRESHNAPVSTQPTQNFDDGRIFSFTVMRKHLEPTPVDFLENTLYWNPCKNSRFADAKH